MNMSAEERLRAALQAQADQVEVAPDALPRIRERIAGRRFQLRWPVLVTVGAVAAVVAAAVLVFAPDRSPSPEPEPFPVASLRLPEPSTAPPDSPTPTNAPATVELPVYYVREDKLVREFHPLRLAVDDDNHRLVAAVGEALRKGSASDPDYLTPWPDTTSLLGVRVDGHIVTVDLADVAAGPAGTSPSVAVQQLLYTVAAAARYTSVGRVDGVKLLVGGKPVAKLWNAVDTSGVLRQAAPADVQAPVWVIDPQQGAQVGRSFTVYIAGIVFEGTVNLRVRKSDGTPVVDKVVQLSVGAPAVGEVRVPLTLAPGRYTVEAFFVSMKDGSVQAVDDHDFTVG